MNKFAVLCATLLFSSLLSWTPLHATEAVYDIASMLEEMNTIQNNDTLLAQALQDGKTRAQFCFHCHGTDGNSRRDHIPNLAQQNATYLFTQFEHFVTGERKDYVMNRLAGSLTRNDRIAIALHFADQVVTPREQPVAPSAAGERLYNSLCFACHGRHGHGDQQYPRIAGQPYEFLEKTLLSFLHKTDARKSSPMIGVMQSLSEQQVRDVAAHVAHMP
ncbi:MAG: c-type cytochrome [Bacterioplanes sp.]|nr:c-type cytochrome [Bacterioplanes sp.]